MSLFNDFPRGVPGASNRNAPLGTARWSGDAAPWNPGHILLGRNDAGEAVGHGDDRHAITVAGSRGGKGRTVIIPNLRVWPGSCVVLDPKGENASLTAAHRAAIPGHKVVVLDPHGAADVPDALRANFNPLDLINPEADDAIDLAAAIGDAVMIGSGDGKDIHWNESARQVFEGILLHVASTETGARRSLVRVRQLLTQGDKEAAERRNANRDDDEQSYGPSDALWNEMAESEATHEAVRERDRRRRALDHRHGRE